MPARCLALLRFSVALHRLRRWSVCDASLQLPWAMMSSDGLLAVLAGNSEQNYLLDVFDPFVPFVEPAVLAGLYS